MTLMDPNSLLLKRTGPGESSLIAIMSTKKTGDKMISPNDESMISINLLIFK